MIAKCLLCGKVFFILNEHCCTFILRNGLVKKTGLLKLKVAVHLDSFDINFICLQK